MGLDIEFLVGRLPIHLDAHKSVPHVLPELLAQIYAHHKEGLLDVLNAEAFKRGGRRVARRQVVEELLA